MKSVILPDELHAKVKALAEREMRSINNMARVLIERGMATQHTNSQPQQFTQEQANKMLMGVLAQQGGLAQAPMQAAGQQDVTGTKKVDFHNTLMTEEEFNKWAEEPGVI